MDVNGFVNNEVLTTLYLLMVNSIYVLLPLSIFFLFFSKISSKVTIFLLGIYASYSIMIPYLLKIPFINDFIVSTGDFSFFVYLIFSLIFGFVFYHLVNLAFIVGGFLLGGLIGYSIGTFIISSNGEWLNNLPFAASYIPWIVFAVLGVIISIIFSKNYESIISTLSIIFGSFILSFYTIFLLEKYTKITLGNNSLLESLDQISQPEFYSIFISFIIYMVIGFYFSMRKNKKDKRIG
ncbi:hypothetical protein PW5551_02985 [Petrotoga sp. 9PW.55.5.1]|uniref:hypothetical protein n=1 Tax=Petrotoga sp. 9PW.55.5.1 TaxID=1308979 RepID=UPI000DC49943|nr:hypothetical protein [Petrotoga sp. 9PW.55.5.1]RAO99471.1 hypothetical protein PW5551_02985 [Petrotoga sp. 9PW.55.5.1]